MGEYTRASRWWHLDGVDMWLETQAEVDLELLNGIGTGGL